VEEALASMRRAMALCPRRDDLLRNHTAILCAAGRHDEAQTVLCEALRQRPGSAELRFALGTTRTAIGDHAAALPELRAAVAADAAHVAARRNLA